VIATIPEQVRELIGPALADIGQGWAKRERLGVLDALVKRYVLEPGSTWLRALLEAAQAEGLATDTPFGHMSSDDTPT
jgi:hypothetical protein